MRRTFVARLQLMPSLVAVLLACGTDDTHSEADATAGGTGSPDQVGEICEAPGDCYPEVELADLAGPANCLDRVRGGYCTHECAADMDCCAAEGECLTDLPQVCSPFESTGLMLCFLSCERADVSAAGADDEAAFCQHEASPDFICRSSGGGSQNRKVCVPGDCGVGAACGDDIDCEPDLACVTDVDGGYCGRRDCQANADCPGGSSCIEGSDFSYCARGCEVDSDCSFCRPSDGPTVACVTDVTYVDPVNTGPVCVVG